MFDSDINVVVVSYIYKLIVITNFLGKDEIRLMALIRVSISSVNKYHNSSITLQKVVIEIKVLRFCRYSKNFK